MGELVTIYRIEAPCGRGPYNGDLCDMVGLPDRSDDRHPNMYSEDWERWPGAIRNYRFGFTSLEQLFDWFAEWLDPMAKHGGEIVVYTVPSNHIAKGKKQAVFDATAATEAKRIPTDRILDLVA